MTKQHRRYLLGGFTDAAPTPLASSHHMRRFVVISAGIAAAVFLQGRQPAPAHGSSRVPLYIGLIAVELLLVSFVAAGVRGHGGKLLDVFGRRWRTGGDGVVDVLLAMGTVALLRLCAPALYFFLGRWSSNTGFLLPEGFAESAVWIAVSITAGICEEVVYRGYLQRQLWCLTGILPSALVLQALVFGLGHIYQGWRPAIVTAIYGLVFGLLAAWRRSVVPGAIAHTAIDLIGGLGPR